MTEQAMDSFLVEHGWIKSQYPAFDAQGRRIESWHFTPSNNHDVLGHRKNREYSNKIIYHTLRRAYELQSKMNWSKPQWA